MQTSNPDLAVETAVSLSRGGMTISASLKNRGKTPLRVVIDDYYCEIHPSLFDAKGKKIEGWDSRALEGMRLEPEAVTPVVLPPGAAVEFASFRLTPERATAACGSLSWELQGVAGQTLQVEFTYLLKKEGAAEAAQRGAAGAEVGTWTSARVPVPTTGLTIKQVRVILSEKREVTDAGAAPLLIEALESSKDATCREYAAVSLGNLRVHEAAQALATVLLRDKVRDVRLSAARALTSIAAVNALDALIEASCKDSDDLVRFSAAEALARLPHPRAVEGVLRSNVLGGDHLRAMAKALPAETLLAGARRVITGGTPEWQVRRTAVDLLAETTGDGLRLTLILRCLQDPDPNVRLDALRAAGKSKSNRAIEGLIRISDDSDSGFEARSNLKDLTGERFDDGAAWKKWWEETGSKNFKVVDDRKMSWSLHGKPVPRKEYEEFLSGLKPTEKTWFCKETSEGGVTGEDMKDSSGTVHQVRVETDLEGTSHSIRRKD